MRLFLAIALLLALAPAAHATSEIRYSRDTLQTTVGAMPEGSDAIHQLQQFQGPMSFGMAMNRITWVDGNGILGAMLIDAGNEAEARSKAEWEHRNQTGTFTYSWEAVDPSPGLSIYASFAWGNGQGGTFGGKSNSTVTTSAWAAALGIDYPEPLLGSWLRLDANWNFLFQHYHLEGLPVATGTSTQPKYDELSFQAPVMLALNLYPLPWLRFGPTVGYDPVMGLFSLLAAEHGSPRQTLYYGAEAQARLFNLLHLSAAYQVQAANIALERPLDESRLTFGAGLEW